MGSKQKNNFPYIHAQIKWGGTNFSYTCTNYYIKKVKRRRLWEFKINIDAPLFTKGPHSGDEACQLIRYMQIWGVWISGVLNSISKNSEDNEKKKTFFTNECELIQQTNPENIVVLTSSFNNWDQIDPQMLIFS